MRLEALEQRTVLAVGTVDVTINGLITLAPDGDGWDEGEALVISAVTAVEIGNTDITAGHPDVRYTYTFTDELTSNSFDFEVAAGLSPNQPVPWSLFTAIGINNGTYPFVDVTVTARDISNFDATLDSDSTSVILENTAPTITYVGDIPEGGGGCGGGGSNTITLLATIGDPGPLDLVTTTINWGEPGDPSVHPFDGSEQHSYPGPGTYTVTLTATDDDFVDPKTTIVTYEVDVSSGGGPSVCFDGDTGVITVTGSDSGDTVVVNSPKGKVRVAADFLPGPNQFVDFPAASVTQIVALLGGGNDVFTVSGNVSLPIVAVGGAGDDTLAGGRFRNILIGGIGADTLYGGRGEDVLIGGSTDHDANAAALLALMAEWSSSHTLEERIRNLVNGTGTVGGGANGTVFLTDGATGTIHDDGDVDILISGAGTDWLFLNGTAEHLLALGSNHDLIGDDLDSLF